ncbi:MAG: glycosyltransferase family 2 protein [bacterium]|nr:glycosyltransferase family 2 protein [bacterium]
MQNEIKKVIVCIPAFNEETTLASILDKISLSYPPERTRAKGFRVEILVVNDGSTDRTETIAASKNVMVISHSKNLGLGAATRTGLETAYEMGADIAVKFDADFQHVSEDIEKVLMPILENQADICWGSRFKGTIHYNMPFIRYTGNQFFTWLMNKLTNYDISDGQTGIFACARKYLAIFEIYGDYNSNQQLLLDANYKHMRYAEVPVDFYERGGGKSFVNLSYPFRVIPNILRVIVYANPLKVFGGVGLLMMGAALCIVALWYLEQWTGLGIPFFPPRNSSLTLFLSGLQTCFFGVLCDLILKKRR